MRNWRMCYFGIQQIEIYNGFGSGRLGGTCIPLSIFSHPSFNPFLREPNFFLLFLKIQSRLLPDLLLSLADPTELLERYVSPSQGASNKPKFSPNGLIAKKISNFKISIRFWWCLRKYRFCKLQLLTEYLRSLHNFWRVSIVAEGAPTRAKIAPIASIEKKLWIFEISVDFDTPKLESPSISNYSQSNWDLSTKFKALVEQVKPLQTSLRSPQTDQ